MRGDALKSLRDRQASIARLLRPIQQLADLAILVFAFQLAYLVRFDFALPEAARIDALLQLPYVVLIQAVAVTLTGVQAFIWRYIGLAEALTFLRAACWSAVPLVLLRLSLPDTLAPWRVPISVTVIDTLFAFGGLVLVRVLRRAWYERREKRLRAMAAGARVKRPILLIGAGRAGQLAAKEIQNRGDADLDIKGFVDDNPAKHGLRLQGIEVLGSTSDLPRLVPALGVDHVVISISELSRADLKRITGTCERIPVKVRIIPEMYEILQGTVSVSRIRDIQIEDLLGREPVQLNREDMQRLLAGRTVMVTGAGGSIGAELARQVARFKPAHVLLVERAESALFGIERELEAASPDVAIVALLADIADELRMRSLFARYRPQVVLHAAAHKHVPMSEYNPGEVMKNNVLATRLVGELAGHYGVDVFVLISTDKAVRPRSVMGASKRLSELVVQHLNRRFETRYVAVRFGNVIGSAGSVIPIFREQIRKGGPVTVTHRDMVRYFMTIPEAAQLVLQAAAIGRGGEIFTLDMGEPVRILDLAKDVIRLSGLRPFEDIDIEFTGLRPGEKLVEELETTGEHVTRTRHPKIFIGRLDAYPDEKVVQALEQLAFLARTGTDEELCLFVNNLLPDAHLDVSRPSARRPMMVPKPVRVARHVLQMPLERARRDEPAVGED